MRRQGAGSGLVDLAPCVVRDLGHDDVAEFSL